jgi:hypothetical protein
MGTLPHELVAVIGDFLAPKWRYRLFMCCRLWRDKCLLPQKYMFDWYRNIQLVNKSINGIQYDAYSYINDSLYCTRSLRININGSHVEYFHEVGIDIDISIGRAFCSQYNEFYKDDSDDYDYPSSGLLGYHETNLINKYYEAKEKNVNRHSLRDFVQAYNDIVVLL